MRSIRHAALTLLTGLVAALLIAAPAGASIGSAALADCNAHDTLTQSYTAAELQDALATMPATMKEYTDCQDVINRALNTALSSGHGNGGSSGSGGGSSFPTAVVVILVLLALAAATFGALEVRRRRAGAGGGTAAGGTAAGGAAAGAAPGDGDAPTAPLN
jgi:hypothetical protein